MRMIEGGLLIVIVMIATTCPEQPIACCCPACRGIGEMTSGGPAPAMMSSAVGLFAGLLEVAGPVSRLDRTVEAHAAEPGFCHHADEDKTPTGPESDHPACSMRMPMRSRARRRQPGSATPGRTFRHRWEEVGLPWRKTNGSPSGSPDSR